MGDGRGYDVARPTTMGRALAVMAGWYALPMLAVLLLLGLSAGSHRASSDPARVCTKKTLECWQMSDADAMRLLGEVGGVFLLATLPVSLIALAVMVARRMSGAGVTGSVAAFLGWILGCALLSCLFVLR